MNQISTSVKKYIVLTWSKGEYLIDERQHDIVLKMGLNDRIDIDGNLLYGKSISEVITLEEKSRRDNNIKTNTEIDYYQNYTGVDKTLASFTPSRRKKALESMRKGFLKNFEGREIPYNAQLILKNMEYRIGTSEW